MPNRFDHLCGHVQPTQKEIAAQMNTIPIPVFSDVYNPLKGSGRGKTVILTDYLSTLIGSYLYIIQKTGDCCSTSAAQSINVLLAVEILLNGDIEEFPTGGICSEDLYGGSRVQIGKGRLGNGQGSTAVWTAAYANKFGTLARKKYGNIDLSKYDVNLATRWGQPNNGTPKELLDIAREHTVGTVSQVGNYYECIDALANGYTICCASNYGFDGLQKNGQTYRDKDGFAKRGSSWAHSLSILGFQDNDTRPGCMFVNTWPINWIAGPKVHNMVEGSFFVDADVVDTMCKQGDSWIYSSYNGFPARNIDLRVV